jgi:hypothetical protein
LLRLCYCNLVLRFLLGIPRRLNFICRRFGTLCSIFPMEKYQSVPKRRHVKFRRWRTTQKKTYNIQNTAKIWNQEYFEVVKIFEETAVTIYTVVRANCKLVCTDEPSFRCVSPFPFVIIRNFTKYICQTVNLLTSIMEMPIFNFDSGTNHPNVYYLQEFIQSL